MPQLGIYIKKYRAENNLTQIDLANRVEGITSKYISLIELGTINSKNISYSRFCLLAEAMFLTPDALTKLLNDEESIEG